MYEAVFVELALPDALESIDDSLSERGAQAAWCRIDGHLYQLP